MIYISSNISTLEPIKNILDNNNISSYQIVEQALSKNPIGVPRLNTAVWPGYNCLFFVTCKDNQEADTLINELKEYNKNAFNKSELITVCAWDINEYFFNS